LYPSLKVDTVGTGVVSNAGATLLVATMARVGLDRAADERDRRADERDRSADRRARAMVVLVVASVVVGARGWLADLAALFG
jgi:hypothetical protein